LNPLVAHFFISRRSSTFVYTAAGIAPACGTMINRDEKG
jgi:hypothetical protein